MFSAVLRAVLYVKIHIVLFVLGFYISVCRGGIFINGAWHTHMHTDRSCSCWQSVMESGSDSWSISTERLLKVSMLICKGLHAGPRGGVVLHHKDKQAHYGFRTE